MNGPGRPAPPLAARASSSAAARPNEGMPTRRLDSRDLLGNAQEIEIDHDGHIYRLRRTSLGKLILTK